MTIYKRTWCAWCLQSPSPSSIHDQDPTRPHLINHPPRTFAVWARFNLPQCRVLATQHLGRYWMLQYRHNPALRWLLFPPSDATLTPEILTRKKRGRGGPLMVRDIFVPNLVARILRSKMQETILFTCGAATLNIPSVILLLLSGACHQMRQMKQYRTAIRPSWMIYANHLWRLMKAYHSDCSRRRFSVQAAASHPGGKGGNSPFLPYDSLSELYR